jgi:hypothetical protein
MMKWQLHFATPPMISAVRAEPYPGAYGAYANCESLRHGLILAMLLAELIDPVKTRFN